MELIIQSFASIFLWLTTVLFVASSLRNTYRGFCIYWGWVLLCVFLGFQRPIFYEGYIVPLVLLATIPFTKYRTPHTTLIILLIFYVFVISFVNSINPWPEHSYYIYGLVFILTLRGVLNTEKKQYTFVLFLWCYCLMHTIWYLLHGQNIFSFGNEETRLLAVNSVLIENSDSFRGGLDPNYFGYLMGTGAFLSALFYYFYDYFKPSIPIKISSGLAKYILIVLSVIQLFFAVKGLSRGVFLAIVFTSVIFLLILRKQNKKYLGIITTMFFLSYVILQMGIIDALLGRFQSTESASRSALALIAINAIFSYGGIIALIFGCGTDFPWYHYTVEYRNVSFYSTHNSWLDLGISYGLIWLLFFLIIVYKRLRIHLVNRSNPLSVIKVVMFAFLFLIGLSLEPLRSQLGWLILAFCFV